MTIVSGVRIAMHITGKTMSLSSVYCWSIITIFHDHPSDKHVNQQDVSKIWLISKLWNVSNQPWWYPNFNPEQGKKWKEKKKLHLCTPTLFAKTLTVLNCESHGFSGYCGVPLQLICYALMPFVTLAVLIWNLKEILEQLLAHQIAIASGFSWSVNFFH